MAKTQPTVGTESWLFGTFEYLSFDIISDFGFRASYFSFFKLCLTLKWNIIFLIIGKGPDLAITRQKIQNLNLEKNIRLLGFISDEQLPSYYNAADFFILPSKSGEGLPLVSLEAMACGLPIIATKVGGIKEILEEKYSILIPPDNSELMEKAILELSQRNFANTKENLRKITELKHSWNNNVIKLTEIYEELI